MQRKKAQVESLKFSERDIIDLQNPFLTPRFHTIKTYNRTTGRLLINAILKSLNCYHDIACLSTQSKNLPKGAHNVYKKLSNGGEQGYVQEFVLEEMFCDFLFIEKNQEITRKEWYKEFEASLVDFNFNKNIPIIIVLYKKQMQHS